MANSKYGYVRDYELNDRLLPGCFIVVRLDGKGFTKFSDLHGFEKPNDKRALDLMNAAAQAVMTEFADVRIAFGESDEYSFVLHRDTALYERRSSKIVSILTSCFTSNYVRRWPDFLPGVPLVASPVFDGRAVCYPDEATLRDYLSWRQVDTHVNNQYNTVFWALVRQGGLTPADAQRTLKGTNKGAKNEILHSRFGINYNTLPEQFKKGSIIVREDMPEDEQDKGGGDMPKGMFEGGQSSKLRKKAGTRLVVLHEDIIKEEPFWSSRPGLLSSG